MSEINTEKIMSEIRENISKRGYSDNVLDFEDVTLTRAVSQECKFDIEELERDTDLANSSYIVHYGNISGRGTIVKRLVRKAVNFLLLPIVTQQTQFNASVVRNLNQIRNYFTAQRDNQNEKPSAVFFNERQDDQRDILINELATRIAVLEEQVQLLESKVKASDE